jgi:hypothetical protein
VTQFQDLYSLPEDDRIRLIGHYVVDHGQTVGVMLDDQPEKIERYLKKLKEWFPGVVVLSQKPGPVADVVTIIVGPQ